MQDAGQLRLLIIGRQLPGSSTACRQATQCAVPTAPGANRADPTAVAITEFERVCGEIRTLGEDAVYRTDGLLQQIIA